MRSWQKKTGHAFMHYPTWLSKYMRFLWRWWERMSFYHQQQKESKEKAKGQWDKRKGKSHSFTDALSVTRSLTSTITQACHVPKDNPRERKAGPIKVKKTGQVPGVLSKVTEWVHCRTSLDRVHAKKQRQWQVKVPHNMVCVRWRKHKLMKQVALMKQGNLYSYKENSH